MHKLIVKQAVESAQRCEAKCLETASHCLKKGGGHADVRHINTLLDCARACGMAADYMTRHSERHMSAAEFCMKLCEACANECDKFKSDDFMKECADACREFRKACIAVTTIKT